MFTKAITKGTDLLETLASQKTGEFDQSGGSDRRVRDVFKKMGKLLFGLFVPSRVLGKGERVSLPKEIGNEDPSADGSSQDISTLQSLRGETVLWGRYLINTEQASLGAAAHPKIS